MSGDGLFFVTHLSYNSHIMLKESFAAAQSLPENQEPIKQFALREAWSILMHASVVDPSTEVQQPEVISNSRLDTIEISGSALRSIRKTRCLTQKTLSEFVIRKLGGKLSRGYISVIEKQDPARISRTKAMLLATALGTGIDDMIFRDGV